MKKAVLSIALICAAAGVAIAALSLPPATIHVKTEQVRVRTLEKSLTLTGAVAAQTDIVLSSLTGGRVVAMLVSEGEFVEKGAPVAVLSPGVSAELPETDSPLPELLTLAQSGSLELSVYNALPAFAAMSAETGELPDVTETLASPCAGSVVTVAADVGETALPGAPIVRVCDMDTLAVTCLLSMSDMRLIRNAKTARISAGGSTCEGELSELGLAVSSDLTGSSGCKLTVLPGEPLTALVGAEAEVTIPYSRREDVLALPLSALSEGGVYLLKDGRAVFTPVETGMSAGTRIQALSGVSEGDLVITDPAGVYDGAKVEG